MKNLLIIAPQDPTIVPKACAELRAFMPHLLDFQFFLRFIWDDVIKFVSKHWQDKHYDFEGHHYAHLELLIDITRSHRPSDNHVDIERLILGYIDFVQFIVMSCKNELMTVGKAITNQPLGVKHVNLNSDKIIIVLGT